MQTRPQPDTISFTGRLILLMMVAGVFDVGYRDYKVLDRIEILLQAARPDTQSTVVSIFQDVSGTTDTEGPAAYFYTEHRGTILSSRQNIGRVNARGFYSWHTPTASCNIPHQNSDEDEAFVSLLPVA